MLGLVGRSVGVIRKWLKRYAIWLVYASSIWLYKKSNPEIRELTAWAVGVAVYVVIIQLTPTLGASIPSFVEAVTISTKIHRLASPHTTINPASSTLAKLIETRRCIDMIAKAKSFGIKTGVIVVSILPPCKVRPLVEEIFNFLSEVRPDFVYGETLHIRGVNIGLPNSSIR
ncbi:MAG: hypothetical protein NZ921_03450 [Candidatus Caldarchaeum sp.]|nr:hypothetical protein [Candidatus Caldarchaeum sp.]